MSEQLHAWRSGLTESTSSAAVATAALEVVVGVGLATGIVAALQSAAPPAGLGAIYLLAVLEVAIRRGQVAALASAVLSFLALNYFFIAPRHQLSIAHTADLVELIVFLIVAVVVGRLAAAGRQRAAEAESRAREAAAREREATLLAEAASGILAGRSLNAQLGTIGALVAQATGATRARVVVERVPSPAGDEYTVRLTASVQVWLYVSDDAAWARGEIERIAEPLGRLIDVAVERERVAEQAAEAEAASRAEVARTAVLHAISHDLRSPLTAITTAAAAMRSPAVSASEHDELIDVIDGKVSDWPSWSTTSSICQRSRPARWCRARTGAICTTSSPPPPATSPPATRSSSRCRATCRWSGPTPPSSSACSPTCWRTRSSSRRRARR